MASLVVRPEKIGDLVVATPVFRALKESFPGEPVHLLTDELTGDLVERDPNVDRIIRIPWKDRYRGEHLPSQQILSILRKNGPYRRGLILYPEWNPWNWILGLAGVREVAQLGGTWSAVLWRHRMALRKNHVGAEHISDLFLQVAAQVGVRTTDRFPRLYLGDDERAAIAKRFPFLREPRIIFVHPFCATVEAYVPARAYYEISAHLAERTGARIYIVGTQRELERDGAPTHPAVSPALVGKLKLRETMAALSYGGLVLGGSSGIIHMAAALGVPTLGLDCPGGHHHFVWGALGPRSKTLTPPASACKMMNGGTASPCQAPHCDLSFAFSPDLVQREAEMLMAN